jgi:glutaconate CoA-transferase, subunit A
VTSTSRTSLASAVAEHIPDGATVFLGGFGHAVPNAAGHELIRAGRRGLTVVRSGCDILVDQLIAAGCVERVVFGWIGNPGIGLAHAFRRAVAAGTVSYEEWTNFSLVLRLEAARLGVGFLPARVLRGGDARAVLPDLRDVTCPYTGEILTAVPALRPDVAIVHAQRADTHGNIQLRGVIGDTVTGALAADAVVATVEEIVAPEEILDTPNDTVVPAHRVAAVVEIPWGAHPSYVHGHYRRDDRHYRDYDAAARTEEGLAAYLDRWVHGLADRDDYVAGLDRAGLAWNRADRDA